MKRFSALIFLVILATTPLHAQNVINMKSSPNNSENSPEELQKRVLKLEQDVLLLQQKMTEVETSKGPAETWICTYKAITETYTATGASRAVAAAKAFNACKVDQKGDAIFCKESTCEQ